jgi:Asp-tRNA(Asn)/Glu-tRNA(Gln) amidotransferase A subunit family amidase
MAHQPRGPRVSTAADDLAFAGAARQAALIRERRISPVELVTTYLDRIGRLDGHLRAFITVCSESALAEAERAQAEAAQGAWRGPLHGVPFAVKDQLDTAGIVTTSGSALLKLNVPSEDSTVVAKLKAAGGILLGKLNLTEFALGGTLRFPYGQPRNPWNPEHDPGGSSSGSGIAAAAALCSLTLGEDTGGSVRSPASYCGAVGLRPTWGRVSRHGCFPAAWSMDQVGPLTRTVEDCALVLALIAGYDAKDPTSSRRAVPDYRATIAAGVKGTRIGVITELVDGPETQAEVRGAVREAARGLAALGATVEDISLPLIPHAGGVFMALCDSEAAGRHKRWLATRAEEYDAGTRRRLVAAGLIPAVPLHRAARARALIREQVLEALRRFDLLLAPTSPHPAPAISFHTAPVTSKEEAARRFFGRRSYTTPASLAGVPAISVPCGFTAAGLPVALQLIGRPFTESTIFAAAGAWENAAGLVGRRPPLAAA